MAKDIVLVHAMSHGALCWELLEPRLRRATDHNPMLSNPDALARILEAV